MTRSHSVRHTVNRFALSVGALLSTLAHASASQQQPVWFWFATCGGPAMTLEVRLDNATIYESTFPVCHGLRGDSSDQGQRSSTRFSFTPQRAIRWAEGADVVARTRPQQRLQMDLWQAGADPEDVLIGVSVSDGRRIYTNTVHIALPTSRRQSTLAPGVTVATYPAEAKK